MDDRIMILKEHDADECHGQISKIVLEYSTVQHIHVLAITIFRVSTQYNRRGKLNGKQWSHKET